MANDTSATTAQTDLKIPDETAERFPELIGLIKKSQSMDTDERQYWIDVLPIMTEDQVENLKKILENERRQVEEAEKEYQENLMEEAAKTKIYFDEFKYKEKKRARIEAEKLHELEESEHEAALLEEISKM